MPSLHDQLKADGWEFVRFAKGHRVYRHPNAETLLTVAGSASDWRSHENVLAQARRLTGIAKAKTGAKRKPSRSAEAAVDPRYPNDPTSSWRPTANSAPTRAIYEIPAPKTVPVTITPARDPLATVHPAVRRGVERELVRLGLDHRSVRIESATKVVIDSAMAGR